MRWPWKKKPKPLPIPPFRPELKPVEPQAPTLVVEEHDTSAMTQTGVHKAWKRLTGQS